MDEQEIFLIFFWHRTLLNRSYGYKVRKLELKN